MGVEDRDWFREDAKRRAAMLDRKAGRSAFWVVERWLVVRPQAEAPIWKIAMVWVALVVLLYLLFDGLIA